MNILSKTHRPAALIASLLGAVIVAGGAVVLLRSRSNQDVNTVAASEGPPLAARVDQLDGTVGIAPPTPTQGQNEPQTSIGWTQASVNAPVSVGSRVYARANSRIGIAFSGRNYARLNPNTSLDVLSLAQRRTQLALREGSCVFSVGALAPDELFEVGTPGGAVDFTEPGLYQVGIDDGDNVLVSCLSGAARVVSSGGTCQGTRGQLLTFAAAAASEAIVSQLSPAVAGGICNDYYSYRYPSTYDGRYADYSRYIDDPYYYDPYRRSVSYQYVPDDSEVAGLDDLDQYGDWSDVPGYGHCWHPREAAGWAPYRDGSWSDDYPLGLTWVASERWGWAPYHYGRWAHVNGAWYWVPSEVATRPVYAPALVAFVQLPQPDRVGWLPLGPGDPYVPRYYDQEYRPQYIGSTTVINKYINITTIANYNVPGAVTVVPTTEFTRVITPAVVETVDPAVLSRTRPVVDPFAVPSVRQLAPNIMAAKPAVPVPVATEALGRPVVISQNPVVPQVAVNTVQALKAQPIPEDAKKRKLELKNARQPVAAVRPDGLPVPPVTPQAPPGQNASQQQNQSAAATQERQARIAQLATQAAQGDKSAKQEMRQLQDQQRIQDKMDRKAAAQQPASQQTTPQQGGQAQQPGQRKAEKQAARQQDQQAQQQADQQRQAQAAQLAAQQKAQKQAAREQAQQQAQQQAAQQEQLRQQEKAQRKAVQQQQPPQQGAAQQQQQQQRQQDKARRKAEQQQQPQQPAQQAAQQQQQQQQEKAQRRAAAQQAAQDTASQQQQAAQQRRAQKQAQQQAAQQQAAQQQAQQSQQQRQQQKAERRAQQQSSQQPSPQQPNPSKAERKAKNKNSTQQ